VRPVPYDPERSLALLHEAGYRDDNHDRFLEKGGRDLSVQLIVIGDDEIKPRATIALQRVFYEIGVKMKVVVIPPDTILAHDFYRGTFQMIFMQANVGIDPAIAATVWHSRGRYNFGMYHNAEVDSFFNQGRQTLDNRERAFIYQHIHALIARDHPACFLFFRESLVGLSSRLQGARGYPENILSSAGRWKVGRPSRRNGRLL
jgi:peptide/nickel transport system substrate-binding protein